MKFSVSGGIYGKQFVLKILDENGKEVARLIDGEARRAHSALMGLAPGVMREMGTRALYEKLTTGQSEIQGMGEEAEGEAQAPANVL